MERATSNSRRTAKIVLGTAAAGGFVGALLYAFRRAQAAEGSAAAASVRAARAEQAAIDAGKREQQAQNLVAWSQASAKQAGVAAQAAIDTANRAITRANDAANQAREAAIAAQSARNDSMRVALERDAAVKAAQAQQLQIVADTARQAAVVAEGEARKRIEADNQARAAETEARKVREQAAAVAAAEKQQADARILALECSRQAVSAGFRDLSSKVRERNPKATAQQVTNITATIMRQSGINLDSPNPALPFWQQPCEVIRSKIQSVINVYLSAKQPSPRPAPANTNPEDFDTSEPTPQVSTSTPKQQWAQQAWAKAIEYAQRLSAKVGKPLDPANAELLIRETFQRASCTSPIANCAVPALSALSTPAPFWALPDATVRTALDNAYAAVVRFVNYKFLTLALDPKGNEILVLPNEIQRASSGVPLTKTVPAGGGRLPLPLATTSARALDPNKALAGYSGFSSHEALSAGRNDQAFRIL